MLNQYLTLFWKISGKTQALESINSKELQLNNVNSAQFRITCWETTPISYQCYRFKPHPMEIVFLIQFHVCCMVWKDLRLSWEWGLSLTWFLISIHIFVRLTTLVKKFFISAFLLQETRLERPYVSLPTTSSTHIEQEYIMWNVKPLPINVQVQKQISNVHNRNNTCIM